MESANSNAPYNIFLHLPFHRKYIIFINIVFIHFHQNKDEFKKQIKNKCFPLITI